MIVKLLESLVFWKTIISAFMISFTVIWKRACLPPILWASHGRATRQLTLWSSYDKWRNWTRHSGSVRRIEMTLNTWGISFTFTYQTNSHYFTKQNTIAAGGFVQILKWFWIVSIIQRFQNKTLIVIPPCNGIYRVSTAFEAV